MARDETEVAPGGAVVHRRRPAGDDAVALAVEAVADDEGGEVPAHPRHDLRRRETRPAQVVGQSGQAPLLREGERQEGRDGVRHDAEGQAGVGPHETGIGLAPGGGVDQLRRPVARASLRQRVRGDEPGEAHRPEVQTLGGLSLHDRPQPLHIEFLRAVERPRIEPFVLGDRRRGLLLGAGRHPVHRDRTREQEADRGALPGPLQRPGEHPRRAVRVDPVGEGRDPLGAGREDRREVEDRPGAVPPFELAPEGLVEDVAPEVVERGRSGREIPEVHGHHRVRLRERREPRQQRGADLPGPSGDQGDRGGRSSGFAHAGSPPSARRRKRPRSWISSGEIAWAIGYEWNSTSHPAARSRSRLPTPRA